MAAFACNGRGIAMTMVMGTGWTRQGSYPVQRARSDVSQNGIG